VRIVAFAKNLLIGGFIPVRIIQTMRCIEMLFPINGKFVAHDKLNIN